jgi:thymidylate kinase
MSTLIILEGARGTGKSTLSFRLRQKLKNSTLINFTGFNDDGVQGLQKVSDYYNSWFESLRLLSRVKNQLIICDRFFPSEMVYSSLYKSYDFSSKFKSFCRGLPALGERVVVFYLKIHDENELVNRLQRDKIPFANAIESVEESLKQQDQYDTSLKELDSISKMYYHDKGVRLIEIDTTNKSIEELTEEIINYLKIK